MENDKKQPSKMGSEISTQSTKADYLDINTINRIDALVEALKDSTLAKQFVEESCQYDEDGNEVAGTKVVTFNKADMVMCLGLGESLGMNPFVALSYGARLNIQAIKKITTGEKLGLDFTTSMAQIYIWGEGTKEIVYTSIHIVNACLTKAGITREILQDGTVPQNKCIVYSTGKVVDFDSSIHKALPTGMADAVLETVANTIMDKGSIPVKRLPITYTAEVKLTRYNRIANTNESITSKYTTQQAIDAGLLKGINSWGEEVKGKDNWNSHPATHLIKMCIMNGGRIIASDVLQGLYIGDEITQIKTVSSTEKDTFEDAEVIAN